ncbi:MAG TPA: alanine/glycine:cation symporter family protein [Bacteroidaceae bacterium]|nr:alanine/glycine:cation symporter family protein [Bacteroidaceae bacterium]
MIMTFNDLVQSLSDFLWIYILIVCLLGCAFYFTIRAKFVQLKEIKEMGRLLLDSSSAEEKHISSFEAFAVSLAARVGTGNLAGVATAIVLGGPGAVFWMWIIALFGAATSFVESTLAQLYKVRGRYSFVGGPAYYMMYGLGRRWMGVLFAVLITVGFGFVNNSVQSNTIAAAFEKSMHIPPVITGCVLLVMTLVIIFGGIHRVAKVSSLIVPFMALGYLLLSIVVVAWNITELPSVFSMIFRSAFGWEQALGGGIGAALMNGIKRGIFSNEAGEGSAPNAAATADVTHPVKQGLVQALGVFTDTLVICSCTAFIILCSGASLDGTYNGIQLTQVALSNEIGSFGGYFVMIAIFLFAYSSVLANYYYGEANVRFITHSPRVMLAYRLFVGMMVLLGACMSLELAWNLVDVMIALMTACNLVAIIQLSPKAFALLTDYQEKRRRGIKNPIFKKEELFPDDEGITCW